MCSAVSASRTDAFQARIESAVPNLMISQAQHQHHVDEVMPAMAIAPRGEEELARALHEADTERLAVIAVGSATHLEIGNVPRAYDIAIETTALNQTIDHEPDDMTVTVDAGVTLSALQRVLAEHGQRLPIDPPYEDDPTIGGLLAVNAYGPARHAFGTLRDWVIGMRVALPDGSVVKSGGRVVKNVSGYDMHKLHIGALGTLGVITQATFKLAPLPHTSRTVLLPATSAQAACALVMQSRDAGLAIQAAEVLSPATALRVAGFARWCLLMRVAGSSAAVERSLRDLHTLVADGSLDETSHDAWLRWSGTAAPASLSLRLSVLPSRVAELLQNLETPLNPQQTHITSTVAAGVVRLNVEGARDELSVIDGAKRCTARAGGFVLVENAPPDTKRAIDVFGATRSDFEVMRRLKQQFDPHGTLAPGRFLGKL
jgi:glycolate oxidase FAD binding subunit